jgi:hypothetical protein
MMKKKNITIIAIILIIIIAISGCFIVKKNKEKNREYTVEKVTEYKYFVVKEGDKFGVIDSNGKKIIETKYDNVKIPNPEKAVFFCYEEEDTKILNEEGTEIFNEYEEVEPLRLKNISSDLMYEKTALKYSENGKYGIIDFNGKKLTKAKYDEIDTLQFKEGELLVKSEGKYGVINIKGATIVKVEYDKIESDKYYDEQEGYKKSGYIVSNTTDEGYRYGYVSVSGKKILDTKFNELYRITQITDQDAYIIVAENGKYGVFKNEKNIVSNDYQSLTYDENNNLLVALKGKKYGVVSMEGEEIVPYSYNRIDITGKYIYATKSDETVVVYDVYGNETDMNSDTSIINIANTDYEIYIQTVNNRTIYNVYKNQKQIIKNDYTYIEYLSDNYFIACDVNGKLGIIDENEDEILNFEYSSIQKIENTKMIQAKNASTNVTEIYSEEFKKICEMQDATVENKDEYIIIKNEDSIKYISKEGNVLENKELFTNNNIFAKSKDGKWGFVDINGNKIVDFKYDKVTEVNQYGFAGIKLDGKWGVINNNGDIIVEPIYNLNNNEEPTFIGEYYQVVYGNGEIYYTK